MGLAIGSSVMTASLFWDRVGAVAAPWMTAAESSGGEPGALEGSMPLKCLDGVEGATGNVTARRGPPAASSLVHTYQGDQHRSHGPTAKVRSGAGRRDRLGGRFYRSGVGRKRDSGHRLTRFGEGAEGPRRSLPTI
jgi:hypothetical protein